MKDENVIKVSDDIYAKVVETIKKGPTPEQKKKLNDLMSRPYRFVKEEEPKK